MTYPPASQLPDIDELFQAVEREVKQQRPIEYAASSALPGTPDADPAAPYVRAAAVLCTFDLKTLRPFGETWSPPSTDATDSASHPLHLLVGHSTMVIDAQGHVRSCLRDSVRRAALAELLAAGRVEEALKANPEATSSKSDTTQWIFGQILTGSLLRVQELRLEELTALQAVAPWVEGLNLKVQLPSADVLRYHLERERLLDPFRRLLGHWEDGAFVEYFRGRERELRQLRQYVDVAESQGFFESSTRGVIGAVSSLFNLHKRPPLVIYGPGGVGKSTLMAKFLLQHAEAHQWQRFPFAYIDFDRPDVAPVEAQTILAEIARQLAMQYPKAEEALHEFRRRLQVRAKQSTNLDPSIPVQGFYKIYSEFMEPERPLLLVFDTFEEVQQRSRDEVNALLVFLDRLQGFLPRLRTVLVGRAPVTSEDVEFDAENVPLLDLDDEAARSFLSSRGIRDKKVAGEIIGLAGRQPLALKLAADLVLEQGVEGIREAAGSSGVSVLFRSTWSQTAITGRLYQRLLNHITDPEARRLAHPGLVLRRITREIIRDVLAKPCGLGVVDDRRASELFERLRQQVSLVAPAEPGVLRHRADVRQIMLPLILTDESDATRQIQEGAVKFYKVQEGAAARAEEIYHRLMLGESPRSIEARWVDGLREHLRNALDELPPRAQAFVAARIGEERSDAVWLVADIEDWELYAEQRIRKLLEMEEPERAEEVLRQRSDRSAVSRLFGLEALVLDALGQGKAARDAAEHAAKLFKQKAVHDDIAGELEVLLNKSPDRSGGLFSLDELKQLVKILMISEFVYSDKLRRECFRDLPRDYLMSIPVTGSPQTQLSFDLQRLNLSRKLPNGSHPMVPWLEQAHRLLRRRPEAKALQSILTRARRRAGEQRGDGRVRT